MKVTDLPNAPQETGLSEGRWSEFVKLGYGVSTASALLLLAGFSEYTISPDPSSLMDL
jgi:hypothetical protein